MTLDDLFSEIGAGPAGTPIAPAPAPSGVAPPSPPGPPNLGGLFGGGGGKMQRIMQLLPLILSGIQGKEGVGAFMHGWQQADDQIRQQQHQLAQGGLQQQELSLRARALDQQQQERQAVEADRKAREAAALERAFVNEMDKATSKPDYDALVTQYETLMGAKPNTLRAKYPYTAPNVNTRAARVWQRIITGPGKDAIKAGSVVNFDVDGDGIPERVPIEKLAELAGQPLLYDPQTQEPILVPTEAKKPGDKFQELLTARRATFQAEKGRPPTSQEDQALIEDAIKTSSEDARKPDNPEMDALTRAIKEATLANLQAQGGSGGLTPEGIDFAATQYRVTGTMPPLGMNSRGGRTAIINKAAEQAKAVGQTPAQAIQQQAAYKADGTALTQMRKASSAAEAFETKALQQADIVTRLSDTLNRTQYPIINRALQAGRTDLIGDSTAQQFANAVQTFSNEYAKIMEGSTGSSQASTESARKAADRLIATRFNKKTLMETVNLMKREMALTIDGYYATIGHITTRMGGTVPADVAAPTPAPSLVNPFRK